MKTILYTGGTGLIGTPQVKHFLGKGYRVITTYRSEEKISEFVNNANFVGIKIDDLLNSNVVDLIIGELENLNIFPEYLVNMACDTRWHKLDENGFATRECMLNHYICNVVLPYELSFRLVNHPKTKLKKIINISSMYGIVPYDPKLYNNPETETPLQYSLSKSAEIHLTKELAIRFREKGIMVNCISYGGVEGRASEDFKERFKTVTPLKRMMKPEETIAPVEFLIDNNSAFIKRFLPSAFI